MELLLTINRSHHSVLVTFSFLESSQGHRCPQHFAAQPPPSLFLMVHTQTKHKCQQLWWSFALPTKSTKFFQCHTTMSYIQLLHHPAACRSRSDDLSWGPMNGNSAPVTWEYFCSTLQSPKTSSKSGFHRHDRQPSQSALLNWKKQSVLTRDMLRQRTLCHPVPHTADIFLRPFSVATPPPQEDSAWFFPLTPFSISLTRFFFHLST